jgi:hypothetical protein
MDDTFDFEITIDDLNQQHEHDIEMERKISLPPTSNDADKYTHAHSRERSIDVNLAVDVDMYSPSPDFSPTPGATLVSPQGRIMAATPTTQVNVETFQQLKQRATNKIRLANIIGVLAFCTGFIAMGIGAASKTKTKQYMQ